MSEILIKPEKETLTSYLSGKASELISQGQTLISNVTEGFDDIAMNLAPYRTGELSQSHTYEVSGFEGVAYATAPQFLWVIEGTMPHDIFPVEKKALWWPEADHPVAYVHHPGTQPNDYMLTAMSEGTMMVEGFCDEFLNWLVE